MSFLGMGRPQPTSEQKIAAVESEMRMMADTYNRLQQSCQKKCIPNDYREGEAQQGRVCLPRPLHSQVPRHIYEGQRDHAAAGPGSRRRPAGRWWHVLSVMNETQTLYDLEKLFRGRAPNRLG
ncbi:hypothetical protein QL093DRAFT_2109021 [Fusarium oxysporum]|nr:hypothetical protein QL093DRAFT_2109021 [Fusarium oxysporum]